MKTKTAVFYTIQAWLRAQHLVLVLVFSIRVGGEGRRWLDQFDF